jgi:hypothetical protein
VPNDSQLGIGCSGVGAVAGSAWISDDPGQAGMLSVGGSGGQMSVSSGGAVVPCSLGGHVRWVAADAR